MEKIDRKFLIFMETELCYIRLLNNLQYGNYSSTKTKNKLKILIKD